MKTRTDFVSNSSSSSFILADSPVWDVCCITKQDIVDALVDSYGKDAYDEFIDNHQHGYERATNKDDCKYMSEDWYVNMKPFYVYDMADEADMKNALARWSSTLKGWKASNCHLSKDGKLAYMSNVPKFMSLYNALNDLYEFDKFDVDNEDNINNLKVRIRHDKIQPNGTYCTYADAPSSAKDTLLHAYREYGVIDNLDVLKNDLSRFFVHFDDNEAWAGKGCIPGKHEKKQIPWKKETFQNMKNATWIPTDKDIEEHNKYVEKMNAAIEASVYETESYSGDRLFEIIYNWLVKIGKVKPDCIALLELHGKDRNGEWRTMNGKTYSWRDLADECLTICCHEG